MHEHDRGRRLIDAYRATTMPDEDDEDAILARVLRAPSPRRGVWRRVAVSAVASFLIAAAVLLLLRGAFGLVTALNRDVAPTQAPYDRDGDPPLGVTPPSTTTHVETRPAVTPIVSPTQSTSASAAAPASAPARPRATSIGPARLDDVERSEDPREASTLADEARLLAAAQEALRDGDSKDALRSLDTHAAQFPDGAMRAERESLRAIALCEGGRVDEGVTLVRRLLAADAAAPYASRMRAACSVD